MNDRSNTFSSTLHKDYFPLEYMDIKNAVPHASITRPKLTMEQRAAQFAPFAALTGFDEIIQKISSQKQP